MAGKHLDFAKKLDTYYEFDREPVSSNRLCGWGYFAATYAGAHIAATEFVVGSLFVSWGAELLDIFVGLLIGNVLAVLSWTLVCAPIATQTRLTLYWYLHKVGGPLLAFFYNICNALLFCVLAGCMVTVSASAVRLAFNIPAQTLWYPTDIRFVLIVLLVGAVMIFIAVLGFKRLAVFSSICSPWMIAMFFAGAVVVIPLLAQYCGIERVRSVEDLSTILKTAVWTGETGAKNSENIGFWHIVAFAWICNLAMHIGLSDMAIFRFAKKSIYGLQTWTGMFIGHYVAWICAGILGAGAAVALNQPLTQLDPGGVAFEVLGLCGCLAVVISGWTTANLVLYQSGLAFQAVTPNWPRWMVTIVVGAFTTAIACFPFVFSQMLNFIGIYGILLMPVGAIITTEHWVFPKIGFTRYWAGHTNKIVNIPAAMTWIAAIALASYLWKSGTMHLFFLFIPIWIFTVVAYIVFAGLMGAKKASASEHTDSQIEQPGPESVSRTNSDESKKPFSQHISAVVTVIALLACLVLPMMVCLAKPEDYQDTWTWFKKVLIVPTIIYFVVGTYWKMNQEKQKG